MGFRRGLTALLLLLACSIAASGAENLMRTVRQHYTQAMRVVDDVTMTHCYLAPNEWGELVVVDSVNEWILDNRWRRERVWINPVGDRSLHAGYESGGTRSTVIYDGRETWVLHEDNRGSRLMPVRDALREDPSMRKIDYYSPEEPFMRNLPPNGYEVSRGSLFGRPCIIAECDYGNRHSDPQDGEIRIQTAWIDRDNMSVLRLRGLIYRYEWINALDPMARRLIVHSDEIQIDNTAFETISQGYLTSSLPTETVISINGEEDLFTTYWYNTGLPYDMFQVSQVIVVVNDPVYIPVPGPHPRPCRGCRPPHPPHPHPHPHPGPPPDDPEKRPPRRPRPGPVGEEVVIEDTTPNTVKLPPDTKPYPKPTPKPKPKPGPVNSEYKEPPTRWKQPSPPPKPAPEPTERYKPAPSPKPSPAPTYKPVSSPKPSPQPKPKPTPPPSKEDSGKHKNTK